jgi:hypothetical protein
MDSSGFISEWMNFSAPGKGEKFIRILSNRAASGFESAPAKPVGKPIRI